MTDQKPPEEIADDDLDAVQGAGKTALPRHKGKTWSGKAPEAYLGETEKNIAATAGSGRI